MTVVAIREVAIKYIGPAFNCTSPLRSPVDVVRYLRNRIENDNREHFIVIYLNARHKPIGDQVVSIGSATASIVHPREVFQGAVLIGAHAIIMCHNHPSGDAQPSDEDSRVTHRLYTVGEFLGVKLLDHIIWTQNQGHISMREEKASLFELSAEEVGVV